MARLTAFGAYLPADVVTNRELAEELNVSEDWIVQMSGIHERRRAAADETVAALGLQAAQDCLARAGLAAADIDLLLVSSGSSERRFPGPAAEVAHALGLAGTPVLDVPVASAGSLFALALADRLAVSYSRILVVAAERMTSFSLQRPLDVNTAILFGDGAGACLLTRDGPGPRIVDSVLHSDGAYAGDLYLGLEGSIHMNGGVVIMQASRKMPAAIREVLDRNGVGAADVHVFLAHQANQNLMDRVARSLGVGPDRFFSNIARRGNTSSASMLIAAAEYFAVNQLPTGARVCFAAFGAGFHWGALLAKMG